MRTEIATACSIARLQRICREQVLQIREHQLLMLLLVIQPQRRQRANSVIRVASAQQRVHVPIDVLTVAQNFRDGRPRQQTALDSGRIEPTVW